MPRLRLSLGQVFEYLTHGGGIILLLHSRDSIHAVTPTTSSVIPSPDCEKSQRAAGSSLGTSRIQFLPQLVHSRGQDGFALLWLCRGGVGALSAGVLASLTRLAATTADFFFPGSDCSPNVSRFRSCLLWRDLACRGGGRNPFGSKKLTSSYKAE